MGVSVAEYLYLSICICVSVSVAVYLYLLRYNCNIMTLNGGSMKIATETENCKLPQRGKVKFAG